MLLFVVITVNECCTSSPVHAHNQTVTVMVLQLTVLWAMAVIVGLIIFIVGINVFNDNSVQKTTFSLSCATWNTD